MSHVDKKKCRSRGLDEPTRGEFLATLTGPALAAYKQRYRNFLALRRRNRQSDSFCGDGVLNGRYFSNHGFVRQKEDVGPMAKIDLKLDNLDAIDAIEQEDI